MRTRARGKTKTLPMTVPESVTQEESMVFIPWEKLYIKLSLVYGHQAKHTFQKCRPHCDDDEVPCVTMMVVSTVK